MDTPIPSLASAPSPAVRAPSISSCLQVHSALSNLALLCMLGGTYAIYSNKERFGKPHWTTWHAWAGLLALALWAANVAVAGSNTMDVPRRRLWFLWTSRNHRQDIIISSMLHNFVHIFYGVDTQYSLVSWRVCPNRVSLFLRCAYRSEKNTQTTSENLYMPSVADWRTLEANFGCPGAYMPYLAWDTSATKK